jgi:serine/threonine-protein kinase HipA
MAERPVDVFVQIVGRDFHAGTLWAHRRRGTESATFAYNPSYLASRGAYALDPALPLVSGQLQPTLGHGVFGAFSDSAPGSWGRLLIDRHLRGARRSGTREGASSGEVDLLFGVRDDLRAGSLRFRDSVTGDFLAEHPEGTPRVADLPRLLEISERAERDAATEDELAELMRSGSSLGGSRPKVHVVDADGRLGIAKLPRPTGDAWNVEAWEAVTLELARRAGLTVAESDLDTIEGRSVHIVERFDRVGEERVGYVSAMTVLEAAEVENGSYLDLAEVIEEQSDRASADLHELWRRIAFSILVSNTDDHLRNHGFLRRSSAGWSLSPAFDINPDPSRARKQLSTSIDGRSRDASLETLFSVAGNFRVDDDELRRTIRIASAATSRWREVAQQAGLPRSEINSMAPAFEHESADLARQLARLRSI